MCKYTTQNIGTLQFFICILKNIFIPPTFNSKEMFHHVPGTCASCWMKVRVWQSYLLLHLLSAVREAVTAIQPPRKHHHQHGRDEVEHQLPVHFSKNNTQVVKHVICVTQDWQSNLAVYNRRHLYNSEPHWPITDGSGPLISHPQHKLLQHPSSEVFWLNKNSSG